ncbi:MAG TPA: type II toxin-antitoxin system VapC family toxin, partial [Polyangia bacterium]|nr:type II toxin-antitoxin system VapC family toxin [Polyangia bacterium]
ARRRPEPHVAAARGTSAGGVVALRHRQGGTFLRVEKSARRERNLAALEEFLASFMSLPFDGEAARMYGRIKADLYRQGRPIGANDLLIAAIALSRGLIVVTSNVQAFERVAGLQIETWEAVR